jgi:hypothetical protein
LSTFALVGLAKAQTGVPGVTISPPSSPDMAELVKYQYTVDDAYGVPQIGIPLYTIKSRKLELPISLSYQASGIKVDEVASKVGLGWTLLCGGAIDRVVRGAKDDESGFLAAGSDQIKSLSQVASDCSSTANPSQCMINYYANYYQTDTEADLYAYNAGGISGKFTYNTLKSVVQMPNTDKLVQHTTDNNYIITDESGNKYYFADKESVSGYSGVNYVYVKDWLLSKIVSADKTDSITFVYAQDPNSYNQLTQYQYFKSGNVLAMQTNPNGGYCGCIAQSSPADQFISTESGFVLYANEKILNKIIFAGGEVRFTNVADRQDIRKYRTTGFQVYDYNNTLIKNINFEQGYFQSQTGQANRPLLDNRLSLNKVKIYNTNSTISNDYSFLYETQMLPPYFDGSGQATTDNLYRGQDLWGYYNGVTTNTHLVPQTPSGITPANRSVSDPYKKACMLKQIKYPTGGTTSFEFESNSALVNNITTSVGGLRVTKISAFDPVTNNTILKTYKYGDSENGLGTFMTVLTPNQFSRQVTSYITGTCGTSQPSILRYYYSTPIYNVSESNGSPIIYPTITEYYGDTNQNNGKIIKTYSTDTDNGYGNGLEKYNNIFFFDYSWKRGFLYNESVYKKNSDATYTLLKTSQNIYTDTLMSTFDYGKEIVNIQTKVLWDCSLGSDLSNFQTMAKQAYVGYRLLTQRKNINYENNGADTTVEMYNYQKVPLYLCLTSKSIINSNKDVFTTNYKYPHDFLSTPVYSAMVNTYHILSPVITESSYKGINLLNSSQVNYYDWGNNILAPQSTYIQKGVSTAEPRQQLLGYDNNNGNLKGISKTSGPPISYLWGYNQLYPIAQVTNAKSNDIFYDSFEEGNGNSNDSKTGRYCHTGPYSKALTGLDPGNYTLTYWQKSGGTWALITTQVTIAGSTYTIGSAPLINAQIDDIRLYPSDSQMITYTYDPLIGMTSATDSKNQIVYYEYDRFQRLMNIKDKDGNIVKHADYHYQGQ